MSQPRRVLVVDDDPSDNEFLTLATRGMGYVVDATFDGNAALAAATANRPDLVVLDALLPRMDGFQVLREIKRLHPDVPVVMVSGIYRKRSYEVEALGSLGAVAYLHKPVGVLQLWELFEEHLGPCGATGTWSDMPGVPFWRRPLAATVADLHRDQRTGLLFVRGPGASAVLFVEDGQVVFARSSSTESRLDRVLVAQGSLTPEQAERACELRAAHKGRRLGDALVADGLVTPDALQAALARQQQAHVTQPFTWNEGTCYFVANESVRRETFKLKVPMRPLLAWACRHLPHDDALVRFLPRTDRRLRLDASAMSAISELGLDASEVAFLQLADGERSVGKLRAIGRLAQVDAERVLALAVILGLVAVEAPSGEALLVGARHVPTAVPVAGDVERLPPAVLLMLLALGRKTAVVTFEGVEEGLPVTRTVTFDAGLIAAASSSQAGDRLGQVLLRNRIVTHDDVTRALETSAARPGVSLGKLLLEQRSATPDDLHRGLVLQVQQVVAGLVAWRSGTFRCDERELAARDIVPLELDARRVLLETCRTCRFEDIARSIPPPESRLRRTASSQDLAVDLPLSALEDRLLMEADGRSALKDLVARSANAPEATLRAVHGLLSLGLLEAMSAPLAGEMASPEPPRVQPVREEVAGSASEPFLVDEMHAEPGEGFGECAGDDGRTVGTEPDDAFGCLDLGPDFAFEPRTSVQGGDFLPLDGGEVPASGGTAPMAAPRLETQLALADAPEWDAETRAALDRFLVALGACLRNGSATVPASVLADLPAGVRSRLG